MEDIKPGGGDTGKPLNVQKRLSLMQAQRDMRGQLILDCGCGAGQYVMALLELGADTWGVEYDEKKVAQFRASNPSEAHRVLVGNIQALAFEEGSFDIVLTNEVLEHIPDDRQGLREMYRVLRPGGRLFLFSPNRLYPFETHGVYTQHSDRNVPIHTPFVPYIPLAIGRRFLRYWARNYWPWELRQLITEVGFVIVAKHYVWQTFENISGRQPQILSRLKPTMRGISQRGEELPGLKAIGAVSQFVSALKPAV